MDALDVLMKMQQIGSFGHSFSVRKIIEWMMNNDFDEDDYEFRSSKACTSHYETGLLWKINSAVALSIQTDSLIAGPAFAETAIMNRNIPGKGCLDHDSVTRWDEPEELFTYLMELREKYPKEERKVKKDLTEEEKKEKEEKVAKLEADRIKTMLEILVDHGKLRKDDHNDEGKADEENDTAHEGVAGNDK